MEASYRSIKTPLVSPPKVNGFHEHSDVTLYAERIYAILQLPDRGDDDIQGFVAVG
jgi:hypothetical protein